LGNWDVGAMEKLTVDMRGELSNYRNTPSKKTTIDAGSTTFQYSHIPLFHGRGKNRWPPKTSLTSCSCTNSESFNYGKPI
jgi:hypothetical protein